jgi:predicted anti-sigma-YlaC factor YlaD
VRCAEIRELLPAYASDQQPTLAVRRHLATCSDCRAELARYRELVGSLPDLTTSVADVPPDLTRALISIPQEQNVLTRVRDRATTARDHVARNRAAYVGGAVAVAGALGATLWRSRRRLAAA